MNARAYLVGTDVLGAGDGLANQTFVVRIKHIDEAKLRPFVAARHAGAAKIIPASVSISDQLPKAVVDLALPLVVDRLRTEMGIDADITATDAPPNLRKRAKSEFWWGLGAGAAFAGVLGGIGFGLSRIFARRRESM